jgi:hypothetical protein
LLLVNNCSNYIYWIFSKVLVVQKSVYVLWQEAVL